MSEYDNIVPAYSAALGNFRYRSSEYAWFKKNILLDPQRTVLDMGCGPASLFCAFPEIQNGLGVDSSEKMLDEAREKTKKRPGIRYCLSQDFFLNTQSSTQFKLACFIFSFRYFTPEQFDTITKFLPSGSSLVIIDLVKDKSQKTDWGNRINTAFSRIKDSIRISWNKKLKDLVQNPEWKTILKNQPMKTKEEINNLLTRGYKVIKCDLLSQTRTTSIWGWIAERT